MQPVFGHGQLRLYLLATLGNGPRSGYDVMRGLEERFSGLYVPSAGTVYPRLAKLEEEGLVHRTDEGRRSTYRLTDAGAAEVAARADDVAELQMSLDSSVRRLADELRRTIGERAGDLRAQLDEQARQARYEAAELADEGTDQAVPEDRSAETGGPEPTSPVPPDLAHALRWLRDTAGRFSPAGAAFGEQRGDAGPNARGWPDLDLSWLTTAGGPTAPWDRRPESGTRSAANPWAAATDSACVGDATERNEDPGHAGGIPGGEAQGSTQWDWRDLGVPTTAQMGAIHSIIQEAGERIQQVLRGDDPPRPSDLE